MKFFDGTYDIAIAIAWRVFTFVVLPVAGAAIGLLVGGYALLHGPEKSIAFLDKWRNGQSA